MRRPVLLSFVAISLMTGGLVIGGCSSGASQSANTTSKETFCSLLLAFRVSNDSLDASVTSGDAAAAQAAVHRLVEQAKTLQQRAPSDIEPDVAATATFLAQLDTLLGKYGYDLTKLNSDPAAAEQFTAINTPAVQASQAQVRAYGDVDCAATTTTIAGPTTIAATTTISP